MGVKVAFNLRYCNLTHHFVEYFPSINILIMRFIHVFFCVPVVVVSSFRIVE